MATRLHHLRASGKVLAAHPDRDDGDDEREHGCSRAHGQRGGDPAGQRVIVDRAARPGRGAPDEVVAGCDVAVYNRSPAKAEPLVQLGANDKGRNVLQRAGIE